MILTQRRRAEIARDDRLTRSILALFIRDDGAPPRRRPAAGERWVQLLTKKDKEALLVVISAVTECHTTLRYLELPRSSVASQVGHRFPERRQVDDLCHTIWAAMDWFIEIKQLSEIIVGVRLQRPHRMAGSLRRMLREHEVLFRKLRSPRLDLTERMSVLLALIQIEIVFLGHMW